MKTKMKVLIASALAAVLVTLGVAAYALGMGNENLAYKTAQDAQSAQTAKVDAEFLQDFDFCLTYGVREQNEVNTYNNTLTKDLVTAGTATTDYQLTTEDKKLILGALFRYGVDKMPKNIVIEPELLPDGKTRIHGVSPRTIYRFEYTFNGETKSVLWDMVESPEPSFGDYRLPQQNLDFYYFVQTIRDIAENSSAYKNLPASVGGNL